MQQSNKKKHKKPKTKNRKRTKNFQLKVLWKLNKNSKEQDVKGT